MRPYRLPDSFGRREDRRQRLGVLSMVTLIGIGIGIVLLPAMLLNPSPRLMNALVFGSLALGAATLMLSLAADGDSTSRLYRTYARLAAITIAAVFAAIIEVFVAARPIADRGAALIAALLLGGVFGMVGLWRARAHPMLRWDNASIVERAIGIVILVALAVCYGGAVAVTIDQAHETTAPRLFQAELYAQDVRHDDRHGRVFNELHLGPWGRQPAREVDVDLPTYDAVSEGMNVCPEVHSGVFGIGWFRITPCPPRLLKVTHHIPRDEAAERRTSDRPVLSLSVLLGIVMLAMSYDGVASGTIQGRGSSYSRADNPILFWMHVVIFAVVGAVATGVASVSLVRDMLAS